MKLNLSSVIDVFNMLFDPETNKLTALIDYDFSHVASQADEFFYSLDRLHGLLTPPNTGDPDIDALRQYRLEGFDSTVTEKTPSHVDWKLAVMLDEELARAGAERPQSLAGVDQLSSLYWFIQDVSPPIFFLPRWKNKATPEMKAKMKGATMAQLEAYLGGWGY